ncbi:MAG: metallophosphoesterase [Clostridia bacterium]|nr:metallophosphoesterase [Clostridia bacterium]
MATYSIESHFLGDPADQYGARCHFRRYIVEIFAEGTASGGRLSLRHDAGCFYFLGNVPTDGVQTSVSHDTVRTTEDGVQIFVTRAMDVEWTGSGTGGRQQIARLMLCFRQWGMTYGEIAHFTPDEMLRCTAAEIDGAPASLPANEDHGVKLPDVPVDPPIPAVTETGALLSRFAVIADAHVGVRYEWENYDWYHGALENIAAIHEKTPLDFVVQLGDNIDDGYAKTYETDYAIYLEEIKSFRICDPVHPLDGRAPGMVPHYEMQGNHDTSMDTRFFREKLWYTEKNGKKTAFIAFFVRYGGYPLVDYRVSKDGYLSYRSYGVIPDETIRFVESSILEAKGEGAAHIILLCHFGISQEVGAPVLPESGLGKLAILCKKYGIKLYFNGHEHDPGFTLRRYGALYDYDVSMLKQKYGIAEIFEHACRVTVYDTDTNTVQRIDTIPL